VPAAAPAATPPMPKTEAVPKPSRVSVTIAAPPQVKVKDQFMVDIKASEVNNLRSAPFVLSYDPIFVEFVDATAGELLKSEGKPPVFKATNDKSTGQVTFSASLPDNASPVSGSGKITTVIFRAKNQGPASFGLMGVNFIGQGGKQIETLPYNTVVEVK
jgi:general secretion pathway protein D